MIQVVRVIESGYETDLRANALFAEIKKMYPKTSIECFQMVNVYYLEGIDVVKAEKLARELFKTSPLHHCRVNEPILTHHRFVEVAYKPGVMNPQVASILKAAHDLGCTGLVAADTSIEYHFETHTEVSEEEVETICARLLVNPITQRLVTEPPATLLIEGRAGTTSVVPIRELDDDALLALSKDKLFLDLGEMKTIRSHFSWLGRDPTDVELETLAQTWSEHCGHKTFNATLIVDGVEMPSLFSRIKGTVNENNENVVSCFADNSGVMRFYDGMAICAKVETHNSPSAIEPYGGAATGSGGVFRDILGTGQGAEVILSTDMFCLAPPDLPKEELPKGCLPPEYLLRHVVRGVRDYGNRMGIPTANGSFHFHPDFRAKPTVIVGAYGIIPETRAKKGVPEIGDVVIVIGGRTGRDGIHGATFSSAEMTDRTINVNAAAVQIGNPIEEKRLADALIACRDEGLIRAVTDCGAGGFSSAIGEMGSKLGVCIHLEKAPLKYAGLAPWEIWVSESQERMVLAVQPEHVRRVIAICKHYNVEATELGVFMYDHRLRVLYAGDVVCDLDMRFVHDGLPKRVMTAIRPTRSFSKTVRSTDLATRLMEELQRGDVCSKESIVRQYDHGVQGTNALPPYGGVGGSGPNDAVVLTPILGKPYGLVVAHGMHPEFMRMDPFQGTKWAIAEALSNLVAVGGNAEEAALIDNFIWPKPEAEELWSLDAAVDACVHASQILGIPFVSGKDSLSGTYRGSDGTVIKIPPVLCISAFGRIPDVTKTVSSDFKEAGSRIVLVGQSYECTDSSGVPDIDFRLLGRIFKRLHALIRDGEILACHDVSDGGWMIAVLEMCFGSCYGAVLGYESPSAEFRVEEAFRETAGCFVVEVSRRVNPADLFDDLPWKRIGHTHAHPYLEVAERERKRTFSRPIQELLSLWQAPMKAVFR